MPGVMTLLGAGKNVPAAAGSSLLTGLQAFWKLSDTSDSSGNGLTLTNNGTVTFTTGKIGNAATFGGANHLSRADTALLSFTTSFTICAWVKPSDYTGFEGVITKRDDGSNKYILHMEDAQIVFAVNDSPNAAVDLTSASISANTWFFVAAWYDSVAQTVNIRVNDQFADSQAHTGGCTDTTADFEIGAFSGASFFTGQIDGPGVWARTWTSGEHTTMYNGGTGLEHPF